MKAKHVCIIALAALSLTVFNACNPAETIIKASIAAVNTQCPVQVDDGVTITSMEYEDSYLIYNIYFDDPACFTEEMADELKESIVTSLREQAEADANTAKLFESLKKIDAGMIFHLSSSLSTIDIILSPSEVL